MNVTIDTTSSTPPSEQLRDELRLQILGGTLPTGTRLPSIRQLAADLGIAPGTVAKAYADLERQELVASRRAKGTVVTANGSQLQAPVLLQSMAAHFARQAEQLGASPTQAVQALRQAFEGL